MHWLTKRLKEIKKSKRQLALLLNVHPNRMCDLEKGTWKLQVAHISKTAKFLEFEKEAFLDFIAGDISETDLWNYKPHILISEEDFNLLYTIKEVIKKNSTDKSLTKK